MPRHRWCRPRWVVALLLALGVLGIVGGCSTVQSRVQSETRDALAANGLPGVQVSGFYRDVTLTGPGSARADATTLATALEATHGVTYVDSGAEASASPSPTVTEPSEPAAAEPIGIDLEAAVAAGALTLTGSVPDLATKQLVVEAAQNAYGADNVTDDLTVADGTPTVETAAAASTLVGLMPALATGLSTGGFTLRDAAITVSGTSPGTSELDALRTAATEAGLTSGVDLAVDPAAVIATLRQMLAAQPIQFGVSSAQITPASRAVLAQVTPYLAEAFAAQPGLTVDIGGYTSSDGDSAANLVLSRQRAEAVRAALVADGIPAAGLVATGYGNADPVADNATPEGRAQNRRIEFTIVEA